MVFNDPTKVSISAYKNIGFLSFFLDRILIIYARVS
jgi:hypothetical protein